MFIARRGLTVLVSALVVASVMGVPLATQPAAAAPEPPGIVPDDQKFNASTNIDVWERSILTTRADFSGAATEVPVGLLSARLDPVGTEPVRSDQVGIVDRDQQVAVSFDQSRASSDLLSNQDAELVVARVSRGGEVPTTFSEVIDTLDTGNANQNATFVRETEFTFGSDGAREFTFNRNGNRGAGQYVAFVAVRESGQEGLRVSGGDVSADSPVTVVGVEQITVQRAPAQVDAPSAAAPGDDLTFSVDSSEAFSQNDVTHVMMVYNEDTFASSSQSRFTLVVPESEVDDDLNLSEDSTLEHTIGRTIGVADIEDGVRVNDIDLSDGRVSRSVDLGSVVDFVAEDLQGNPLKTERVGGNTKLYASVRATASDSPQRQLTVETFENWSAGTYRYVYIGTLESNGSAVSTQTGTIDIAPQNRARGGGGGGGGVFSSITTRFTPEVDNSQVILDTTISVDGFSSGDATVSEFGSFPAGTPQVPGTFVVGADITVPDDVEDSAGQVRLTVDRSAFEALGLAPEDLRVYKLDPIAQRWDLAPTSVVDATDRQVTIEADIDGFSLFAVSTEATQVTQTQTATASPTASPTPTETTQVTPTETASPTPTPTAGGGPGFGAVVAVVALLGAALLLSRRD